ncbi:MAG TPA: PAS domain S-box protein, partial [Thermoanaerobaculia bacterium]|nr:PAS domain S-box protein [Thermoanaerobaculia bacterium]
MIRRRVGTTRIGRRRAFPGSFSFLAALLFLSLTESTTGAVMPLTTNASSRVLSQASLPAAPQAEFHWLDIWQNYKGAVIGVAALVAALATLVVALLLQRTQRIHSERGLAERLRFERLLSEISASLIAVDLERVDPEVERALSRVLEVLDLDRCALFVLLPAEGRTRITHQAEAAGMTPLDRESRIADAPTLYEELRTGKAVELSDIPTGRPEPPRRRRGAQAGSLTLLSIAIKVSEDIVRGVMFQSRRGHQVWTPDLIPRLRLVGELLIPTLIGKRTDAALRASEERYREVVESQTDLICRFAPDTTLTFVNEAYCRYFGRTREELIGRRFLDFTPEAARDAIRRHVLSLIDNPRVEIYEHEVTRPDGTIGWQHWTNHAIRGRDGRIYEFQGIGQDITDRKHAEEAQRSLAQASRLALLGELTASIAHEINQPLGAILSNTDAAEMLLEAGPERLDEVRAILGDIRREDLRASDVIHHTRRLLQRRPTDT